MDSIAKISAVYAKLLNGIDWQDPLLCKGLREGRNKFLSNAWLSLFPDPNKYHNTHFASVEAHRQLKGKKYSGLVFEHVVPKHYFQSRLECEAEEAAKNGKSISIARIEKILRKNWILATVTKDEDKKLLKLPVDWDLDEKNKFIRYANLKLEVNSFFKEPL
ncbi:hypothetical protein [Leptospira barantonii]|uniref:Uncharacterized protein n=1 Tax=Leptospira barantonii TaxID=2023184 RepID=A0ABX4NN85_9LEPT|nr:hypothetical protein [Leptospira barantonii]PJZ58288.1 hypothetical protein CH367_07885 [Leptospira barantonii]